MTKITWCPFVLYFLTIHNFLVLLDSELSFFWLHFLIVLIFLEDSACSYHKKTHPKEKG